MKRLAVLGQPVSHSLSPRMHAAAFAALGLAEEWTYEAIELSPEGFRAGVEGLRREGFVGVNVTIPHKEAAAAISTSASAAVAATGAANTLTFAGGEIKADNTDAPGFLASLPEGFDPAGTRAVVYGAGGSARAVAWALLGAGASVTVRNRTRERAEELVESLAGGRAEGLGGDLAGVDLLVNTTSIGLASPGAERVSVEAALKALAISADQLDESSIVVDLVYGSEPTGLALAAAKAGARVVDGLEILVRQGAESFRIWTGLDPPIDVMRQAVRQRAR